MNTCDWSVPLFIGLNFMNHANIKRPLSTLGYFPNAGLSSLKANDSYRIVKTGPNKSTPSSEIRFNRAQCFVEHLLDYPHVNRRPWRCVKNNRQTKGWFTLKIGNARFSSCLQRLQVSMLASCCRRVQLGYELFLLCLYRYVCICLQKNNKLLILDNGDLDLTRKLVLSKPQKVRGRGIRITRLHTMKPTQQHRI